MRVGRGIDGRTGLGLFALAILLVVPTATAAVPTLSGTITFETLTAHPPTRVETETVGGWYLSAEPRDDTNLEAAWNVTTGFVTVNWTHIVVQSVGQAPGDPDEPAVSAETERRHGETPYQEASVSGSADARSTGTLRDVDLLAVPSGSARLVVDATRTVTASPATGVAWWAGETTNESTTEGSDAFLYESYETTKGHPSFETAGRMSGTLQGDFTLYVWGVNVTVRSDGTVEIYRSGVWTTEETGGETQDDGVAREEHRQILRLRFVNATLDLVVTEGPSEWTAGQALTQTTGLVGLGGAAGMLRSERHVYSVDDRALRLDGRVTQTIRPSSTSSGLASTVRAHDVAVNVAPSSTLSTPTAGVPWLLVVALAASGTLFGFGVWQYREWTKRDDEHAADLIAAEEALVAHDSETAREHAQAILEQDPEDADAWFAYAASLIQDGEFEQVIDELGPMVGTLDEGVEGPAFYLAYAHAALDEVEDAVDWAIDAAREPSLREKIRSWPIFGEVRRHPRFREGMRAWEDADPERDRAYG